MATTVVEVGVDVPAATVMVIEHAERFGLAQLHQLRGRVGRGAAASFCLLLHEEWVNDAAKRRLTLLRDTDDGFLIADEDFRLRGGGDILGTKQSGLPGFRLADPIEHEGLLHMANRDAAVLLQKDPKLTSERGTGGARAAAAVREGGGDADAGGGVTPLYTQSYAAFGWKPAPSSVTSNASAGEPSLWCRCLERLPS